MTTRPRADERPDSTIGGLLWDHGRRVAATGNHELAEGCNVGVMTILDSYDRQLHPWLHGRRPEDIIAKAKEVLGL